MWWPQRARVPEPHHVQSKLRLKRRKKPQSYSRTKVTPKDTTLLSNCPWAFLSHTSRWCTRIHGGNWGLTFQLRKQAEANIHTPPRHQSCWQGHFWEFMCTISFLPRSCVRFSKNWMMKAGKLVGKYKPAKKRFGLNWSRPKLNHDEFNVVYSGYDCRYRAVGEDYLVAM